MTEPLDLKLPRPLRIITELRKWQTDLEKMVLEEPDNRTAIWVYETKGGSGKSAFCKYLIINHGVCYSSDGNKSELMRMVLHYTKKRDMRILVIDLPRSIGNKVSHEAIEDIKKGILRNAKYGTNIINPCHVIVFSNVYPKIPLLSADKWKLFEIVDEQLESREIK